MFWRKKKTPEEEELDKNISRMKSKNIQESLSAVSIIVEKGSVSPKIIREFFIPMLPKLLNDRNIRVRIRTAFILSGLIFNSLELRGELVHLMFDLLKHNDSTMRLYAAPVFGRLAVIEPEIIKPLIIPIAELLRDRDQVRAGNASFVLGEIGIKSPFLIMDSVPIMNELLMKKQEVILNAFKLISLKHPIIIKDSVPMLINIIKTAKDPDLSWDASILLIRLSHAFREHAEELVLPRVEPLLDYPNKFSRASAVYVIGGIGVSHPHLIEEILPELIAKVTDRESIVKTFLALT
jgi:hypothetical protein